MVLTMKGTIKVWFSLVCAANVAVALPPEEEGVSSVVEFKRMKEGDASGAVNALELFAEYIEGVRKRNRFCVAVVGRVLKNLRADPDFLNKNTPEAVERMNKILKKTKFAQDLDSAREVLQEGEKSLEPCLKDPHLEFLWIDQKLETIFYDENGQEEENGFKKATGHLISFQEKLKKYVNESFDFEKGSKKVKEEWTQSKQNIGKRIVQDGLHPIHFVLGFVGIIGEHLGFSPLSYHDPLLKEFCKCEGELSKLQLVTKKAIETYRNSKIYQEEVISQAFKKRKSD